MRVRPNFDARGRSRRGPSERTARLPRGYRAVSLEKNEFRWSSAGFFDPEFAPALRADITVDQCASIGVLEQRAVAALLITLWGILVGHRRLAHFRSSLLERQQHSSGSCRASHAAQKDNAPRKFG